MGSARVPWWSTQCSMTRTRLRVGSRRVRMAYHRAITVSPRETSPRAITSPPARRTGTRTLAPRRSPYRDSHGCAVEGGCFVSGGAVDLGFAAGVLVWVQREARRRPRRSTRCVHAAAGAGVGATRSGGAIPHMTALSCCGSTPVLPQPVDCARTRWRDVVCASPSSWRAQKQSPESLAFV